MYNDYNNLNNYNPYQNASRQGAGIGVYLAGVFRWMFLGLSITAFCAFYVVSSPGAIGLIASNPLMLLVLAIAEFGLVMYLSARITKISYSSAMALFLIYSALNGVTLSVILLVYTFSSVAYTFVITAVTFGVMSIYGYVTKNDLTRAGNLLFMGLIGVIVLSLVNVFLRASSLEWLISVIGLFVFLGLTAYDTQKIKEYYYITEGNYEMSRKSAIMGALRLYLDFINLFLMILRFFGRRR